MPATVATGVVDACANAEIGAAAAPACPAYAYAIAVPCVAADARIGEPSPPAYPSPTTVGSVDGLSEVVQVRLD
jgi:hypothetical protein